jgi:hypothetical protein
MGRANHGVRWGIWMANAVKYRQRQRRRTRWKYKSKHFNDDGSVTVQHKPAYTFVRQQTLQPANISFSGTSQYAPLLPAPVGYLFHIQPAKQHVFPFPWSAPPVYYWHAGHRINPRSSVVGAQLRRVHFNGRKQGRLKGTCRAKWAAYIHFKDTLKDGPGMWPAWDPSHRTPVDPDT